MEEGFASLLLFQLLKLSRKEINMNAHLISRIFVVPFLFLFGLGWNRVSPAAGDLNQGSNYINYSATYMLRWDSSCHPRWLYCIHLLPPKRQEWADGM